MAREDQEIDQIADYHRHPQQQEQGEEEELTLAGLVHI